MARVTPRSSSSSTADVILAVNSIIHSKTFDNGMICASEQSVTVLDKLYDKVKEFEARGCYLRQARRNRGCVAQFSRTALSTRIAGMAAHTIAKLAGVEVPATAKILIAEVE